MVCTFFPLGFMYHQLIKAYRFVFYFIWIKIYAKTLLTEKDVLSIGFSASLRVS